MFLNEYFQKTSISFSKKNIHSYIELAALLLFDTAGCAEKEYPPWAPQFLPSATTSVHNWQEESQHSVGDKLCNITTHWIAVVLLALKQDKDFTLSWMESYIFSNLYYRVQLNGLFFEKRQGYFRAGCATMYVIYYEYTKG